MPLVPPCHDPPLAPPTQGVTNQLVLGGGGLQVEGYGRGGPLVVLEAVLDAGVDGGHLA